MKKIRLLAPSGEGKSPQVPLTANAAMLQVPVTGQKMDIQ
jgi:hypothetical protein